MIPILTSFLPPSHSHLYLPPLFKFWEAINSALVDDRLLHMSGELSEEHVAGPFGLAGEDGGAKWKDVGIWTQSEWNMLVGKGLASMSECSVPYSHFSRVLMLSRCSRRCNKGKEISIPHR